MLPLLTNFKCFEISKKKRECSQGMCLSNLDLKILEVVDTYLVNAHFFVEIFGTFKIVFLTVARGASKGVVALDTSS